MSVAGCATRASVDFSDRMIHPPFTLETALGEMCHMKSLQITHSHIPIMMKFIKLSKNLLEDRSLLQIEQCVCATQQQLGTVWHLQNTTNISG